jgi:FkbM family methyltransferase
MITFAQNFEDVMLERLFSEEGKGFYVDVGAWDPTFHSVTRHFYDKGWRGINIEPIVERCEQFSRDRPRDVNLCVAVGDQAGAATFFESCDQSFLSTLSDDVAESMRRKGSLLVERRVEVQTLTDILSHHRPETIDFLKIDVEGSESAVLRGTDLSRFRPRAIVIEATIPGVSPRSWSRVDEIGTWETWEPYLLAASYQFAYFDGLNRFYLRNEDQGLAARLRTPPCVHDHIEFAKFRAQEQLLRLVSDDRDAKAAVVGKLADELAAISIDRDKKSAVITRLSSELAAISGDCNAKSEVISRLANELAFVNEDRARTKSVVDRVAAELATTRSDQSAKEVVISKQSETIQSLRAELSVQQEVYDVSVRRMSRKNEVISEIATENVGYRLALGGTLDLAYRYRRAPGAQLSGGRYHAAAPERRGLKRCIAIDAMSITFGVSGGVEVYMKVLIQALLSLNDIEVVIACRESQLPELRRLFGSNVGYYSFSRRPAFRAAAKAKSIIRGGQDQEHMGHIPASFSRLLEETGARILHSPVQIFSCLDFNIPSVFHLHDLQHLHFPENFSSGDIGARNRYYGLSADLADAVVATSDFVRDDIISKMGVPARKVVKIPATWDPKVEAGLTQFSVEDAVAKYRLPSLFGFYPAQFWPHKNHRRLVEALAIVRAKAPQFDFKLVFSGNRVHSGWPDVENKIKQHKLEQHVQFLDFVPFEHLAAIYRGATFCVMPSIFEASSYAVIEAQVLGCPVMCARTTSLPELVEGGAGILFDPFDPNDIAMKMLHWLNNPDDRYEHAERASRKVRRDHGMAAYAKAIEGVYQALHPL